MAAAVQVRGLRELQGAFRQIDRELPKELRDHLKVVADKVADRIRGKVPWVTGEAAGSVRARASQRGAGIAFPSGGTPWRGVKAVYYPWLDFGGRVGRGGGVERPVIPGGRYVYPTIAEEGPTIVSEVEQAIEAVAKGSGFETRGF